MPLGLGVAENENGLDVAVSSDNRARNNNVCIKCPSSGILVLNNKDTYCKPCFLHYFNHKFRSTLAKQKVVQRDERLLIAFSSGPASVAMATLLQRGLSEDPHKRLKLCPSILYIAERQNDSNDVLPILLRFVNEGISVYVLPFAKTVFSSPSDICLIGLKPDFECESSGLFASDFDTNLQSILSRVDSATHREDFLTKLRLRLLWQAARKLQIGKVMLGESASLLAVRVLSHTAIGRGSQLSCDTSLVDRRYPDVTFLRPMKEITGREIGLFNHLCGLESLNSIVPDFGLEAAIPSNLGQSSASKASVSVASLTQSFLESLQPQFPATITAIVGTASKITTTGPSKQEQASTCSVCFSEFLIPISNRTCSPVKPATSLNLSEESLRQWLFGLNHHCSIAFQLCLPCRATLSGFGFDR